MRKTGVVIVPARVMIRTWCLQRDGAEDILVTQEQQAEKKSDRNIVASGVLVSRLAKLHLELEIKRTMKTYSGVSSRAISWGATRRSL